MNSTIITSCFPSASLILLTGWLAFVSAQQARGNSIVNGDFATGDFTGWEISAIDTNGNSVPPLIEVVDLGGSNSAVLSTGPFAGGPFISTLQQTFALLPAEPILSFDFSLPNVTTDSTGPGTSPFPDSLVVSVQNGGSRELLLVIKDGVFADPFGTAPGPIALRPSTSPFMQYNLQADLSALAGHDLTLFLDVTNEDDGFASVFGPGPFFTMRPNPPKKTPDQGLTSFLFLISLFTILAFDLLQRGRTCQ